MNFTHLQNFNSLPTVEQVNLINYTNVLTTLDPQLYLIHIALLETGVNANIIPKVIRSIYNISAGTGYGKVQIFVQDKVITQIKGEENTQINEDALVS